MTDVEMTDLIEDYDDLVELITLQRDATEKNADTFTYKGQVFSTYLAEGYVSRYMSDTNRIR